MCKIKNNLTRQKAIIHYFSGTGNTLLAAKLLSKELSAYGYDVTFHPIERGTIDQSTKYSLHLILFPVYATSVPHIMKKYIRKLPNGNKAKTVVISTNGKISTRFRDGYQGWALHQARLYLKAKNYDVFYSNTLDYPHNVTIVGPPRKNEANKIIIDDASKEIPKIAEHIAKGHKFHRKIIMPNFIWSIPFGIVYSLIGRRGLGKLMGVDTSCNSCGICEKECPAKVIKMGRNGNRWGWNCEGCLKCMNICPKQAIQTPFARILVIIWALLANPFYLLYQYIPEEFIDRIGSLETMALYLVLDIIAFIIFFCLMDGIFYLLSTIPFLRRILNFGHTKFYGRYHVNRLNGKL